MTACQIPAVGKLADPEHLLVGALLWSNPADAADVLSLVDDSDLAHPALAAVLAAIRATTAEGACGPAVVADALAQHGIRKESFEALADALTSGAASAPKAARLYAAMVVAARLRRYLDDAGRAPQSVAVDSPETDLSAHAQAIAAKAHDIGIRLGKLRGEAGAR